MAANSLTINLETVTPIWTGGAKGEADRLHTTGIMGSLRWWYEVLVRGVGGIACDPSQPRCLYNKKASDEGLCDVCRVFGATGWARRFRLIVVNDEQLRFEAPPLLEVRTSRSYIRPRRNRPAETVRPTWYFKSSALSGKVDVKLVATDPNFQIQIIGGLIQFIADWASIGAKPQMGFGIINATPHQDMSSLIEHLKTIAGTRSGSALPTLNNMFFASITVARDSIQETFDLKYDLRRLFAANDNLRHFVMGTVKGERLGAKIMMSRPYRGKTIRLWGWIPEDVTRFATTRSQVVRQIQNHLKASYTLNYWREFDSPLDTKNQYSDILKFLESLLKGEK